MTQKVCIIGAGSSGIAAAKALKEHGIAYDCFEMGSDIGGNWRYNNDNGRSAAYDSLHIDTSKERMEFSDFPMPSHYPNYPHHSQIIAYFDAYANEFDLRPTITFQTRVETVTAVAANAYAVTTTNLQTGHQHTQTYRAVLVCNGHHWKPRLPHFPGTFSGDTSHSRTYRSPLPYAGKNVLVVGMGNSGVDIACDIAKLAQQTYLSTRRGAHILPRYILGRPTDKWLNPISTRLPFAIQVRLLRLLVFLAQGDQGQYGVPKPAHKLQAQHPTMSAELLNTVAHGSIVMKPDVAALEGSTVRFADGSAAAIDAIIYATGYKITFPFLEGTLLNVENNDIPLYRKVVHPDYPNLYFIGLIQPLGAIMPLAELQAQWVARLLTGESALPERTTMLRDILAEQDAQQRRYVASARHTIQVDFWPYKRQLAAEIGQRPSTSVIKKGGAVGLTAVAGTAVWLLLRRLLKK